MSTRLSGGTLRGDRRHRRSRLAPVAMILLFCVAVVTTGCIDLPPKAAAATPTPTHRPPGKSVVFIGDSLTVGLYASTIDTTFASLLAVRWKATLLDRVGVAGVQADGLRAAVQTMEPDATDTVVEVGTNDFVKLSPEEFSLSYRALITAVKRREPHAQIVCLGLWRSATERSPTGQGPDVYDALIQAACPGPFIPLLGLFMIPSNRGPANQETFRGLSDAFHPNDRGHDAIASAIAAEVKP